MVIKQNVPLAELTTLHMGGPVPVVVTVTSQSELAGSLQQIKQSGLPFVILGWGSNVVGHDEGFHGVIIVNKIGGFEVVENMPDGALIRCGAGESLDTVVARSVELGLSGIEALSSIPGTIGAAPVQNAGAYGQEIADTFVSLQAIDTEIMTMVTLSKDECQFGYRDSLFKHNGRRYAITEVTLRLSKKPLSPPFYQSLQTYFTAHSITDFTPATIRDAVVDIRKEKLPSPILLPNAGSFFKNPIVTRESLAGLKDRYPEIPAHETAQHDYKIPAGWLIETAGLKGASSGSLRTYEKNALVIVNSGASTYRELTEFRARLIAAVHEQFGITLEQEPEEIAA